MNPLPQKVNGLSNSYTENEQSKLKLVKYFLPQMGKIAQKAT